MRWVVLAGAAAAALALAGTAVAGPAGQGETLFKQDCVSCHTVGGGDGVGPDLRGVVQASGDTAIGDFIADPAKAIAADTRLKALVKRFHGVQMPDLGLSSDQIASLVAYLKASGQGAVPAKPATPATAAPAGNAQDGKSLFTGAARFAHGGAACISCHSIGDVGALGGGRIGPDLSRANAKYGGAKGLASVLSQIAFPRMVPVYREHALTPTEQADLVAFLASHPAAASRSVDHTPLLVLLAVSVTAALLALALVVWPRRRLVVRKRIAPTSTIERA